MFMARKWLLRLADTLSHLILIGFMVAVITAAIATSLLRYYLPQLDDYKAPLFAWLQETADLEVQADRIDARWSAFKPDVTLNNLTVRHRLTGQSITLDKLRFEISIIKSLFFRRLHFHYLEMTGLDALLRQNADLQWQFTARKQQPEKFDLEKVLHSFWVVDNLELSQVQLAIVPYEREPIMLSGIALSMHSLFDEKSIDLTYRENGRQRSRLLIDANGRPGDDNFIASIYWQADSLVLHELMPLFARVEVLSESRISHELWLQWRDGNLAGSGRFAMDGISWRGGDDKRWTVNQPNGEVYLEGNLNEGLHFSIPQLAATINQQPVTIKKLKLHYAKTLSLQLQRLDLSAADRYLRLLPLNERLQTLLDDLAPTGFLDNVNVVLAPGKDLTVQAYLNQISVGPWQAAPALQNVNGYLDITGKNGFVVLESENGFAMHFPKLFNEQMQFESANGRVQWRVEDGVVHVGSDVISLDGDYGKARGGFQLYLPIDGREPAMDPPRLSLLVGLSAGKARYHDVLVPYTVEQGLLDWLDSSVRHGSVRQGAFVYHGPVRESDEKKSVQLWLDIENGSLAYAPEFPTIDHINGEFLLDDGAGFADVRSAQTHKLAIDRASLVLSEKSGRQHVAIEADVKDKAGDVLAFLQLPALSGFSNHVLDQWQINRGQVDAGVSIETAIRDIDTLSVQVDGTLDDVSLALHPYDIVIDKLAGELDFSLRDGLSSRAIAGELWGEPVSAVIGREPGGDASSGLIELNTRLAVAELEKRLQLPVLGRMNGKADVEGSVYWNSKTSGLRLSSTLQGLGIDLPEPLGKSAGQQRMLRMHLPFTGDDEMIIRTDDGLELGFLRGKSGFDAARLTMGVGARRYIDGTFLVNGTMMRLDVQQWLAVIDELTAEPDKQAGRFEPVVDGLNIRDFSAYGYRLESVSLSAMPDNNGWLLQLMHSSLDGSLLVRRDDQPWQADIEHADLAFLLQRLQSPEQDSISPADVPDIMMRIKALSYNGEEYGSFRFLMHWQDELISLSDIHASSRGLELVPQADDRPCRLRWTSGEQPVTEFDCRVETDNIALALKQWGYRQEVNSRFAAANINSRWQGEPGDFSLAGSENRFSLKMDKGNFADISGSGTDALKLLGILNVNSLLRRIQLDFSDLTNQGLAFDSVAGEATLNNGVLATLQPFRIQGSASQIRLAGGANLLENSLDMTMTVSLPLASNLPWVVALAAGLPAAIGVYVVSKFLEEEVDQASSVVYTVTGGMDDPKIKFQRLFDTGADSRKSKNGEKQ